MHKPRISGALLTYVVLFMTALAGMIAGGCRGGTSSISAGTEEPKPGAGDNIMRYAEYLRIENRKGYRLVTVLGPDGKVAARYAVVSRSESLQTRSGQGQPDISPEEDDAIVIMTPVKSLVITSEIYYRALSELGGQDMVRGVADARYFKHPEVREGIASGRIADVGTAEMPVAERVVQLRPELMMLEMFEGMQTADLSRYGVNYLKVTDSMEPTPLGRAEWIKLFGLLAGKEQEADSIFASVEEKYTGLAAEAGKRECRPVVILDKMYQGVWYMASGESYMARMIADAGGDYPWSDTKGTGSRAMSLEEVYVKAKDADIWLIRNHGKLSVKSLEDEDSRYGSFSAVRRGDVYVSDTSESMFFDDLPFHPERALRDFIEIFSGWGGNMPASTMYFRRIEK